MAVPTPTPESPDVVNEAKTAEQREKAVKEALYRQERDEREAREFRRDAIKGWIRAGILVVVVAIGLLMVDGVRREARELTASVVTVEPATDVYQQTAAKTIPAKVNMDLLNRDNVNTDIQGNATLSFPDGSAILVEPSTQFEVRLLDYARNGRRDRSFMLRSGSVFSRISKMFGAGRQTLICTPNAVAAARGTGYSVVFAPQQQITTVDVVDGKVLLKNAGGQVEVSVGYRGIAHGNDPPVLVPLDAGRSTLLTGLFERLRKLDTPPNALIAPIIGAEHGFLGFLDPVLQKIGLVPGGWRLQDNDDARRLAAQVQLRRIGTAIEEASGDSAPEHLSLATLAELSLEESERDRILSAFAGIAIDSYARTGQNGYVLRVRARDSQATVFELTPSGVKRIEGKK